ncbi:sensor histidine kinase [Myxococcus stipitatus DSM 14675]|uniref:histidine kinase n=1 Tax=Myxococcus stipitatus (strain DSM 14675 / JCM 12634 / Mx s8) TaxID=1278073 RepID=L7UMS5_MYXSD|nr:ATP-binding protein [Myxococcus stipitatus]AGC48857.1 sensor histidine kinase [Myxococcus stipitatus DSM 14675]
MTPSVPPEPASRARINLEWLLRLRWGLLLGQAVVIAVAAYGLELALPVPVLAGLLGLEAATNLAVRAWLGRARVSEGTLGKLMLWDTLVLTGLLALSGGTHNPFTTLYLVNVALGTVLLPARWMWSLLGFTLAAFGSLFVLQDVDIAPGLSRPDHAALMRLHLSGMWVAFAVAAGFIVYFVQRVTRALEEREQELAQARVQHARREKVASLATLAAGAAHELSTPLSTIAVVSKEVERALTTAGTSEAVREDLRLIRQQVDRCRDVLVQMSADAGQTTGEAFHPMPLGRLVGDALAELSGVERVRVELPSELTQSQVQGPPRALARVVRGLVKNALQASAPARPVELRVVAGRGSVRLEVRDGGAGMPAEILARAGEPFFTTKAPGEGMGLGLFLARTLAEQLGGALELRSTPGQGTVASLALPLGAPGVAPPPQEARP